jgi:mRNA interferase HigB
MRVISRKKLKEFWQRQQRAEGALKAWYAEAKKAGWKGPMDVKAKYGKASVLRSGRVVFDICAGHYRLVVKINYAAQIAFIRFVGTHAEYDRIDADTI